VLVDGDGAERCLLNATAVAVWELCDGETSAKEMVEAACQLWDVGFETAARDLTAALEAMNGAGVLIWDGSAE
jgi:hypothetical protein